MSYYLSEHVMNYKINILFLVFTFIVMQAMDKPTIQVVPPLIKSLPIPGNIQSQMVYTPDGQLLIANVHESPTKNILKFIKTDNYTQATDIVMPSAPSYIVDVRSESVITADNMGPLHRWHINDEHDESIAHTQEAGNAKFDTAGKRLMFSTPNGVFVLDLESNTIIQKLENSDACSADFVWNIHNQNEVGLCYMGDNWTNTKWGIWDLVANKVRPLATVGPQLTGNFSFSNDGQSLVAGAANQFVQCNVRTEALTYYALNGVKSNKPLNTFGTAVYSSLLLPGKGVRFFAGSARNRVVYCDTDDTGQSFVFNPAPSDTSNSILAIAVNLSSDNTQLAVPTQNSQKQNLLNIYDVSTQSSFTDAHKQVKERLLNAVADEKPKSSWWPTCGLQ